MVQVTSRLVAVVVFTALSAQSTLDGLWYRLDSKSDDPKARIEASIRGFIDKQSRGRRTVEDFDPRAVAQLRGVFDTFVQYAEEINVRESPKELVLDDRGPQLRIYYLDGQKHERQMTTGTRLETTATKSGRQIDVFQKTSDGAKIFESYHLSDDGDQMTLTVRLEDKQLREPLVIRSIYTRAE
jgi:hypothetical protein